MKTLFTLILLITTVALTAQTRRIAHRFHSGTNIERFDNGDGSYGGPYIPMRHVIKVDTVYEVVKKDTVVRLVDSSYYELDTSNMHQSRIHENFNDVREYGKICSRFTGTK